MSRGVARVEAMGCKRYGRQAIPKEVSGMAMGPYAMSGDEDVRRRW